MCVTVVEVECLLRVVEVVSGEAVKWCRGDVVRGCCVLDNVCWGLCFRCLCDGTVVIGWCGGDTVGGVGFCAWNAVISASFAVEWFQGSEVMETVEAVVLGFGHWADRRGLRKNQSLGKTNCLVGVLGSGLEGSTCRRRGRISGSRSSSISSRPGLGVSVRSGGMSSWRAGQCQTCWCIPDSNA